MLFSSLWIYISLNNPCSIHPPLPTPRQLYWDVVDIYCWVSLRCTGVDLIHLHIAVLATTLVLADTIMSHNYLLYFFQWKICWHMTLWKCLFFLHVGGSFCCVCNYRFSVISFSTLRHFLVFGFHVSLELPPALSLRLALWKAESPHCFLSALLLGTFSSVFISVTL